MTTTDTLPVHGPELPTWGEVHDMDMQHPALVRLPWDDERTDVHGVAYTEMSGPGIRYGCYCGHRTGWHNDEGRISAQAALGAFTELVQHATDTAPVPSAQ